jgi:hypothetical protein
MSKYFVLAVWVTLFLGFVGSRPVSAQGAQGEVLSLTQRFAQLRLPSRHMQPREQVLYKCQLSRLPYGYSVPQVIRHLPVVNLACGWNDQGNTAYRYSSQGSNYRQYKPTISTTLNGRSLITFKVDHIRGWALDDYGIVRIQLDQLGRIISESCDINIRGKGSFSTGEIINIVPTFRSYTPVFASRLKSGANHLFDKPGRVNFPNEIEHIAISVVNSTVLCAGCHSH